jgi:phosphoglycolate phosphatase-like HAD superfamily hydrolase
MTERPLASIILDIDGTLYDSTPLILDAVAKRHGIVIAPRHYTVWNSWATDLTDAQMRTLIDDDYHDPEAILSAVPYEGAAVVVRSWQDAGHPIHIVSHRAPSKDIPTRTWLTEIGIEPDVFVIARRLDKVAYALEHDAALLVDDKPATIADAVAAGLAIATIIQPYNAALVASLRPAVIAASTWKTLGVAVRQAGVLER